MVLRNRPPLQEVLQDPPGEYARPGVGVSGVTSLAVIGPYAKGDDYEASRLELMVELPASAGLKFFGMDRELSDAAGRKS